MRKKLLAFMSVALTSGTVVAIVACSDSSNPSTFTDNGTDSGPIDSGNGFNTDSGPTGGDASPIPKCNPSLPGNFDPTYKAPTKPSPAPCSTPDLGAYYDACAADLKAQACTDWLAANKACGDCIEPDDNTGPIQIFQDRLYLLANTTSCLELVVKSDTCAKPYDAFNQCVRSACDNCFAPGIGLTSAEAFNAFNTCEGNAATSSCSKYSDARTAACGVAYKDPDGGAPQCFPTAEETTAIKNEAANPTDAAVAAAAAARKAAAVRVMAVMCGP
jgi:hypothetical protein